MVSNYDAAKILIKARKSILVQPLFRLAQCHIMKIIYYKNYLVE